MGTARYNVQRERWMIDYHDSDGRRVRELIGPQTAKGDRRSRDLAREVLREREIDAAQGKLHVRPSDIPQFAELAQDFLKSKEPRVRETTFWSWRSSVNQHLIPAFGDMRVDAIRRKHVEDFLTAKADAGALERSSINVTFRHLKGILEEAVAHGYTDRNHAKGIKPLREEEGGEGEDEIKAFTEEQLAQLFEHSEQPWRTLFYFAAYGTGMRRNEILGLQWSEVDLSSKPPMVHVRYQLGHGNKRVALKTKHSKRDIDISREVRHTLLELPRSDDPEQDWVFLSPRGKGPITPEDIRRAFRRCMDVAGLPGHLTIHSLRHSHASIGFARRVEVRLEDGTKHLVPAVDLKTMSYRLGHSSIKITADLYTHFIDPETRHVGQVIGSPILGNGTATETRGPRKPTPVAAISKGGLVLSQKALRTATE